MNDKKDSGMGSLLSMSAVSFNLAFSIAIGVGIGVWLDNWLHTSPFMVIGFFLLGIAAGFWQIIKELKRLSDDSKIQGKNN